MAGAVPSGAVVAQHGAAALKAKQRYGTFIQKVAAATGIDPKVLAAWTAAEGGPDDNPLNLRPGRHYGSQSAAAVATINTLRTNSAYAPILRAASNSDINGTLNAIAASPWDANHYRGTGAPATVKPGTLLRGVYTAAWGAATKPAGTLVPDIPNPLAGVGDAVTGVENWLSDKALVALLYFSLTGVALGLIVLGLARGTGVSIGGLARTAPPTRRQVQQSEVPF